MDTEDQNLTIVGEKHVAGVASETPKICIIEYWFSFSERNRLDEFADIISAPNLEISISCCGAHTMWRIVIRKMMPHKYDDIRKLENELARHAVSLGGIGDGWSSKPVEPDV